MNSSLSDGIGLKASNGKFVSEDTSEAWFVLDQARFHILPTKPSCSDIFAQPNVRSAYEILSRAASDVLHEYLVSVERESHSSSQKKRKTS